MLSPNTSGYLLLAAEVGTWRGPFPAGGRDRQRLLARIAPVAARLAGRDDVEEATAFRAVLRPPGEGTEILHRRGLCPARYDVVLLLRTASVQAARKLRDEPDYQNLSDAVAEAARRTHEIVARNAARLGDVDHRPDHPFLFNYFYADDRASLLKVWEYTAGWFQKKTGLPNSTLMQPLDGEPADFGIINHASWPNFGAFLPSLVFRPTFRSFVLANFKANGVAAQPILYRRVPRETTRSTPAGPAPGGTNHGP